MTCRTFVSACLLASLLCAPRVSAGQPAGDEAGKWQAVVERLNAEINRALGDPEVAKQLLSRGFEPQAITPAAWGSFIAAETARWGDLIKRANLKAE